MTGYRFKMANLHSFRQSHRQTGGVHSVMPAAHVDNWCRVQTTMQWKCWNAFAGMWPTCQKLNTYAGTIFLQFCQTELNGAQIQGENKDDYVVINYVQTCFRRINHELTVDPSRSTEEFTKICSCLHNWTFFFMEIHNWTLVKQAPAVKVAKSSRNQLLVGGVKTQEALLAK